MIHAKTWGHQRAADPREIQSGLTCHRSLSQSGKKFLEASWGCIRSHLWLLNKCIVLLISPGVFVYGVNIEQHWVCVQWFTKNIQAVLRVMGCNVTRWGLENWSDHVWYLHWLQETRVISVIDPKATEYLPTLAQILELSLRAEWIKISLKYNVTAGLFMHRKKHWPSLLHCLWVQQRGHTSILGSPMPHWWNQVSM